MAVQFFKPAFDIELIQTDNGSEFTNNQNHLDRSKPPVSFFTRKMAH